MRGDFVGAENSTGFHNPREASRMLLQAVELARQGQTKLAEIAAANGIAFTASNIGFEDLQKDNQKLAADLSGVPAGDIRYAKEINKRDGAGTHKAGERYYEHDNINGAAPANLMDFDKNTRPYNYSVMDKKQFLAEFVEPKLNLKRIQLKLKSPKCKNLGLFLWLFSNKKY